MKWLFITCIRGNVKFPFLKLKYKKRAPFVFSKIKTDLSGKGPGIYSYK